MQKPSSTRRKFLKTASTAAAGFMIVPRHVLGGPGYTAPSDLVNVVAAIGAGGKGRGGSATSRGRTSSPFAM